MPTTKFAPVRPFYWSGAVERVSNGQWTIEVYFERNMRGHLIHRVSIESHEGWNVNGAVYGDSVDDLRYDLPERVPAYVKREAARLVRATA